MGKRKSSVLSLGVITVSALLTATNGIATSPTPPTQCTTANYVVNVQKQVAGGDTSYTYTMSSPTGKSLNKFFIYVKGRQVDGQGLQGDLVGMVGNSLAGSYVPNGQFSASLPPSDGWKYIKQLDGWVFPSVAINNVLKLTVSERFQPQEGTTTVLLSRTLSYGEKDDDYYSKTVERCGPILGPTTPTAPAFQGSPLVSTVSKKTFENGCSYFVTAGETDNIVQTMTPDPATPIENPPSVCAPTGCKPCAVDNIPNIALTDLHLVFLPPGELGKPPIQSQTGGICYYPPNLRFAC